MSSSTCFQHTASLVHEPVLGSPDGKCIRSSSVVASSCWGCDFLTRGIVFII